VTIFSTHIKTDDLSKTQELLKESIKILKEKFNFYFSSIQIEQECLEIEDEAEDIDITK
jgi:cobalt-zinc-cadmium efflux system protein